MQLVKKYCIYNLGVENATCSLTISMKIIETMPASYLLIDLCYVVHIHF